jgi:hypothetical protein
VLLALFSSVLPLAAVARRVDTLASAVLIVLVVLSFAVLFELATYLDAFSVLLPAGAEAAQQCLNDRLVKYAQGAFAVSCCGTPSLHLLL